MQNAIGLARVVLAQATPTLRMDGTSARKVCGRRATQSSRPWRRTGRPARALPAVPECLVAEGLRTSDHTRASTSSSRTRRFASWKKKRPPGPSGHSTPRPSPSDMLAGEASQRRRRRTPGELPCPCAGASGVGQGFYRGGFCRHLWNILENNPGEDRPRRCSSLLPSGAMQPQAPRKVLLLVAGGAGPSLRFRLTRRPRQRLPERVVQPGRAAARDAAHATGDRNSHSLQLVRTLCRGLRRRGHTDSRPGCRAAELPPGQSYQSRQT